MRPLNDDMEDLIRKAAGDYPLDVSGAEWQRVQDQLGAGKERRWRLLLLLLLPLLGIGIYFFVVDDLLAEQDLAGVHHPVKKAEPVKTMDSRASAETPETINDLKKAVDIPILPFVEGQNRKIQPIQPSLGIRHSPSVSNQEVNAKPELEKEYVGNTSFDLEKKSRLFAMEGLLSISPLTISGPSVKITFNEFYTQRNDVHNIKTSRKNSFYAGVIGGMDATSIKSQGFGDAGHFYGALGGYYISDRLSIETAIISTQKFYFTRGEYFDKSKLRAPASWRIKDVEGNCRMIEIPLSLRFDFIQGRSTTFFGSTGIRSYLMKKEYYDYNAVYSNGTTGYHEYKFTKGSKHFAAEWSLSAGFEKSFGNNLDVRVEPFAQLPLSKVGIGSLPFTNVGVQLGVSTRLD